MIYGSVCSGIESATAAWHPLGWRPAFFAEIDKFPIQVLSYHYPNVPNAGDFTKIKENDYEPIDLLVGGTPCQDFSVAGLRAGMDGKRGQLTIEFAHLADRLRPRWLVWENVPGVLSIDEGRAFGTFIGLLGKLGYGIAYRVLDAQHFGCACRRPRVFVVGHFRDWRRSAAVLFERESFTGNIKKETPTARVFTAKGGMAQDDRTPCVLDEGGIRIASPLEWERALGFPDGYTDLSQESCFRRRQAASQPINSVRYDARSPQGDFRQAAGAMRDMQWADDKASGGSLSCDWGREGNALPRVQHQTSGHRGHGLGDAGVGLSRRRRRGIADGPRYKALGNSMAVPVMRWIGERIQMVEDIDL